MRRQQASQHATFFRVVPGSGNTHSRSHGGDATARGLLPQRLGTGFAQEWRSDGRYHLSVSECRSKAFASTPLRRLWELKMSRRLRHAPNPAVHQEQAMAVGSWMVVAALQTRLALSTTYRTAPFAIRTR